MAMKQDIHQVSTVQRYPIGFKYPKTNPLDLRSYYYARAGNALHSASGAHLGFTQDVNFSAVTVDLDAVGKYTLEITVAATDGRLGTGAFAANELAGGYIIIFPNGTDNAINRMIVGNTAKIAGVGVMTITVDKPLPLALTPAPHAECIASPYLDVLYGNYDRKMIMGMPTMMALAGEYLWLQTWGPTWAVPGGVVWATAENSLAMFDASGNIEAFDEADPVTGAQQIAGTIMTPLPAGLSGAPFLFLTIAP